MNKAIKIGVIQFPGSNCERETILAVERAGMSAVPFLWNQDAAQLKLLDGYIIVGGFSYEDRSRAGVIASLDPIIETLKVQVKKGKPLLGICNGAQILVETGLVPGVADNKTAMALTTNRRVQDNHVVGTGYYNAWSKVKVIQTTCAFTCAMQQDDILNMPIAHAEGRFMMPSNVLTALQKNQLITLRYCNAAGSIQDNYPINPNGSTHNIAAVCNVNGNVMAMMPHPERTAACDAIFVSMKRYIEEKLYQERETLNLELPNIDIEKYHSTNPQFFVELVITDNHAETVKTALARMGIEANIKRYIHWEVDAKQDIKAALIKSGELFNVNKEKYSDHLPQNNSHTFLVRNRDDMLGVAKTETLQKHFKLEALQSLKHGIIWQIECKQKIDLNAMQHIFFNPYAHEVYEL